MPGPFGGLWWARKGPPTSWHQGTVSGPFRPLATVLPPHAPRPTPHAPRPTPHAPRPMIVGVHRRCRAELGIHGLNRWPVKCLEMLRNVEKCGVQAARNGPSEDRKCWQRVELGIHGLRAGAATGLEKSEKCGVQAARNGPSPPPCGPRRKRAQWIALVPGRL